MINDDGIKGIKDNLLDNNGRARYITEQYEDNQLYFLNDLNFSLCCEEGDDSLWYVKRFFNYYNRLIYMAVMLKNVFIKYQSNKKVIFMRDNNYYNFYEFIRNKYFIFPTNQNFGNLMYQEYLRIFKIEEMFEHTFQINDSNSNRITNILMFWFVIIQILLIVIQIFIAIILT